MSVYECDNRNVLRRCMKTASDDAAVTWEGRSFHTAAPEAVNVRLINFQFFLHRQTDRQMTLKIPAATHSNLPMTNYRADRAIDRRRTILAAVLRAFSLATLRTGICNVSVNGCCTEHLHSIMWPASVSYVARGYSSVCVETTNTQRQQRQISCHKQWWANSKSHVIIKSQLDLRSLIFVLNRTHFVY